MRQKVEICAIFSIVAIVMFILSYNVVWINDDITYQYNFATGEKIERIRDIFESQYVHYFTWNGRYVAHWLCQLFLPLLGKATFSAVNGVMYIALIILILKNTAEYPVSAKRVLTAACLVLFFCDTSYAPTCQIGYIWMSVLILLWIRLFFTYAITEEPSALTAISLFLLSIITGNAQEAINIGVGGALVIYALANVRHITRTQWCMAIGFGIGGLFLCLSPASIGRTAENIVSPLYSMVSLIFNLRVTYIFLAILLYQLLRHRITLRGFYHNNTFYINAIIVLLIFNLLIGVGSNRQLFGIELFSSILAIRLLKGHSFSILGLCMFSMMIAGIYILKFMEIKKAGTVYEELSEKYSTYNSGPMYIDLPEFNQYIRPTPIFKYGVYLDYALSSMAKEQGLHTIEEKIPCYPQKIEEILKRPVTNQAYEYLPGEFILMQSKKEPGQFILRRCINIMGLTIQLPPHKACFNTDSHLNTKDYNIMYIPSSFPIIENEQIIIE